MKVVGNSTRQSENFNGVSEKLKSELIKDIEPNQVVHFQLLNGSFDPVLKREVFGASKSLRLSDRIYDPYAQEIKKDGKTEYKGAYVEIGVPDTIKDGRVERCRKFWVESIANGIPGNGQFHFRSGNVDDMEIYEFLCLSNGSKNNPHRDASKPAKYEMVDTKAILASERAKDKKELENKLRRFAKQYPDEAAEFAKLLPKEKAEATT